MYYRGLDVSMKSTHICIEDARGRLLHRGAVARFVVVIGQGLVPVQCHRWCQ